LEKLVIFLRLPAEAQFFAVSLHRDGIVVILHATIRENLASAVLVHVPIMPTTVISLKTNWIAANSVISLHAKVARCAIVPQDAIILPKSFVHGVEREEVVIAEVKTAIMIHIQIVTALLTVAKEHQWCRLFQQHLWRRAAKM
jgi:hypothetical protein